jgi:hypothetical protein
MFVYCIENTVNGKKYVGISKRSVEVRFRSTVRVYQPDGSFRMVKPDAN